MVRPRIATSIQEQTGAFKKNPNRARKHEPKAPPLWDTPPDHLDDDERAMWFEIVSITPPGVLMTSDSLLVESLAMLWARYRKEKTELPVALISRIDIQMGRLGLSPADRAKLSVEQPKENEFEGF